MLTGDSTTIVRCWSVRLDLSSQELIQTNSEMRAVLQAIPDFALQTGFGRPHPRLENDVDQRPVVFFPHETIGRRFQDVPIKLVGERLHEAMQRVLTEKSIISVEYA